MTSANDAVVTVIEPDRGRATEAAQQLVESVEVHISYEQLA